MNSTIEKIRAAHYNTNNRRIKNVMFCLLTAALLPTAKLAIVRMKNHNADSPVVIYQNKFLNFATPQAFEDVTKLDHELGRAVYEVADMATITPHYLQSRLNFFEAQQVVKIFNALQSKTAV